MYRETLAVVSLVCLGGAILVPELPAWLVVFLLAVSLTGGVLVGYISSCRGSGGIRSGPRLGCEPREGEKL